VQLAWHGNGSVKTCLRPEFFENSAGNWPQKRRVLVGSRWWATIAPAPGISRFIHFTIQSRPTNHSQSLRHKCAAIHTKTRCFTHGYYLRQGVTKASQKAPQKRLRLSLANGAFGTKDTASLSAINHIRRSAHYIHSQHQHSIAQPCQAQECTAAQVALSFRITQPRRNCFTGFPIIPSARHLPFWVIGPLWALRSIVFILSQHSSQLRFVSPQVLPFLFFLFSSAKTYI
jgi:hypothetical protein